ncbi:SNF1 kinase complex beta-subunit [Mycena chlorophos]|uniref:SNF1 kinase complex beta-subunit n=1 Tax=Mycena chlorophos TaxID=658473 RepID=A0A8H6SJG2_MYCCL|nr:SNF1 kinase complex beta-subunit [Mycena chlorophos]
MGNAASQQQDPSGHPPPTRPPQARDSPPTASTSSSSRPSSSRTPSATVATPSPPPASAVEGDTPPLRPNRKSIELPGLNTFPAPAAHGHMRLSSTRLGGGPSAYAHSRREREHGRNQNGSFTANGQGRRVQQQQAQAPRTAAIAIPGGRRGRDDSDDETETGYGRHAQEGIARRKAELAREQQLKQQQQDGRRGRSRSRHDTDHNHRTPSPSRSRTPSRSPSRSPSRARSEFSDGSGSGSGPQRSSRRHHHNHTQRGDDMHRATLEAAAQRARDATSNGHAHIPSITTDMGSTSAYNDYAYSTDPNEVIIRSTIPLTIGPSAFVGMAEGDGDLDDGDGIEGAPIEPSPDATGGVGGSGPAGVRTRAAAVFVDEIVGPVLTEVPIEWCGGGTEVYLIRAGDGDWMNRTQLEKNETTGAFSTTVHLPPGTHHFRFIVDGATLVAPSSEIANAVDDQGFITNYVTVPGASPATATGASAAATGANTAASVSPDSATAIAPPPVQVPTTPGTPSVAHRVSFEDPTSTLTSTNTTPLATPTKERPPTSASASPTDVKRSISLRRKAELAAAGAKGRRASVPAHAAIHPDGSFWDQASVDGSSERGGHRERVPHVQTGRRSSRAVWTSEIPAQLFIAAAQEEEWAKAQADWVAEREREREQRERGRNGYTHYGGGNYGTSYGGPPEPAIPHAAQLPRHLERLILNRPSPGVVIPKVGTGAGNPGLTTTVYGAAPISIYGGGNGTTTPMSLRVTTASGTDVSVHSSMMQGFASMDGAVSASSSSNGNGTSTSKSSRHQSTHSASALVAQAQQSGNTPLIADDPSVLQTPSHAVLYHLCTSSIKDKMIAVGASTRYRQKYLTTVYYKPAEPIIREDPIANGNNNADDENPPPPPDGGAGGDESTAT